MQETKRIDDSQTMMTMTMMMIMMMMVSRSVQDSLLAPERFSSIAFSGLPEDR